MSNGDGCPFCQIVEGEIESHMVHENETAMAFLDVNPVSKGHTLVVPKQHAEELSGLDREDAEEVFGTVKDVAEALENALNPEGTNILQSNGEAAGQEIPHMHVHVIPRYRTDGLFFSFDSSDLSEDEAEEVLESVRSRL
ncbi:MAG: HIT family protein [Candidatus Nanohaloarchaea archaeon]|nr:HIT family protein [Candidatus Nanohaloarchaea archaeon]